MRKERVRTSTSMKWVRVAQPRNSMSRIEPELPSGRQGAGGVHHVALRTTLTITTRGWIDLAEARIPSSGPVDRFYFRSLYFRDPNGILFEIATDEPGFHR